MPALVAGIHDFLEQKQDVDRRVKPGDDESVAQASIRPRQTEHMFGEIRQDQIG